VAAIIDKTIINKLPFESSLIFDLLLGRNRYPNDQGAYQAERFSSITAKMLNLSNKLACQQIIPILQPMTTWQK
jgi:hypothetical protein